MLSPSSQEPAIIALVKEESRQRRKATAQLSARRHVRTARSACGPIASALLVAYLSGVVPQNLNIERRKG